MRLLVCACGGGGRVVGGRLVLRWARVRGRLFGGFRAAGWVMAEFLWSLNRVLWEFEGRGGAAIDDSGGGVSVG